jgi:hypothetical protein
MPVSVEQIDGYYRVQKEDGTFFDNVRIKRNGEACEDIPADAGNTDWQNYQAWLADGNTPDIL